MTKTDDLISRQAAIHACHNWDDGKDAYAYGDMVEERLQKLPSSLPKGHGRLIDADALFEKFEEAGWFDNTDRDEVAEKILLDAPTIIEADKEVSNESI